MASLDALPPAAAARARARGLGRTAHEGCRQGEKGQVGSPRDGGDPLPSGAATQSLETLELSLRVSGRAGLSEEAAAENERVDLSASLPVLTRCLGRYSAYPHVLASAFSAIRAATPRAVSSGPHAAQWPAVCRHAIRSLGDHRMDRHVVLAAVSCCEQLSLCASGGGVSEVRRRWPERAPRRADRGRRRRPESLDHCDYARRRAAPDRP